ncbi:FIST signal transduction protein [Flavobacterium oreochromis]|uniref:Histidine kinase n=2 Tax=Flavobacterium TaxID=237 RepID=A0A246GAT2_9FLAO|nr:FIST N-terminal domain-containing protein [Flavobacterium oreochromis]OWP74740.1 histidine kinase [Flavobacterium oreochromis]OWP77298.1 histidine kinase [Flavobacterium oreochromis]POR21130.1 histidine kinase [Flavobacterium columnare]
MKIIQAFLEKGLEWNYQTNKQKLNHPLVLVLGNRLLLETPEIIEKVREEFPYEHLVFGSTSGEIIDTKVLDQTVHVTAIEFEKSHFIIKNKNIQDYNLDAYLLGKELSNKIPKEGLKHILVISEGSFVNGSSLIAGIESVISNIPISGGICGDDDKFQKTLASYKENPKTGEVILIGLYGETLDISVASYGGWITFGPERLITKSTANILYEIDDKPALELYRKYLGDKANELPKASLLYPLYVKAENKEKAVVRTVLSINEDNNSMTLAGDVPINSKVQLMMTSVDGLSEGALKAAQEAMKNRINKPEFALLVSCIGRKLVMDQRVEEEIEEVKKTIGNQAFISGFYSYGEIAPFGKNSNCELHNQTMTLTLISE